MIECFYYVLLFVGVKKVAELLLKGISKRYLNGINAVSNFNLELSDGEFLVIGGSAGSGKSTILKIICGLEKADEGNIFIEKVSISNIMPKDRKVAIIFPCHELYPNNTVYENLEFSLRITKCPRFQMKDIIMSVAQDLEISDILDKMPSELSKTQHFAAILARCVIKRPKILLIDEPFDDMDISTQNHFSQAIITLNKKFKLTTIVATSNANEALAMNARTMILKNGYVQQVDNVSNIYKNPVNIYVAQFINQFNMTTTEAVLIEDKGLLKLKFDKGAISLLSLPNEKIKSYINKEVLVGIRDNKLKISEKSTDGIECQIEEIEISNSQSFAYLKSKRFDIKLPITSKYNEGDIVNLVVEDDGVFVFDKDTGKTII